MSTKYFVLKFATSRKGALRTDKRYVTEKEEIRTAIGLH